MTSIEGSSVKDLAKEPAADTAEKPKASAGWIYWKKVTGKVLRLGGNFYQEAGDKWLQIYWNGTESAEAIAALGKKVKDGDFAAPSPEKTESRLPEHSDKLPRNRQEKKAINTLRARETMDNEVARKGAKAVLKKKGFSDQQKNHLGAGRNEAGLPDPKNHVFDSMDTQDHLPDDDPDALKKGMFNRPKDKPLRSVVQSRRDHPLPGDHQPRPSVDPDDDPPSSRWEDEALPHPSEMEDPGFKTAEDAAREHRITNSDGYSGRPDRPRINSREHAQAYHRYLQAHRTMKALGQRRHDLEDTDAQALVAAAKQAADEYNKFDDYEGNTPWPDNPMLRLGNDKKEESRILVNEPRPRLVEFSDLITPDEIKSLRAAVKAVPATTPPHRAIMAWINTQPRLVARWAELKILPDYGAYLLEYHLQLGDYRRTASDAATGGAWTGNGEADPRSNNSHIPESLPDPHRYPEDPGKTTFSQAMLDDIRMNDKVTIIEPAPEGADYQWRGAVGHAYEQDPSGGWVLRMGSGRVGLATLKNIIRVQHVAP